jgi:hypothetical protein
MVSLAWPPRRPPKILASYIQQPSEAHQVKVAAEVAHPHLVKQNFRRKQQRHTEEVHKRIEKAEKWGRTGACAKQGALIWVLSTHILRKNISSPEKDQWRQARARAWISGTN